MKLIALFYTHSGAIKYQRFLKEEDVETLLSPTPRKLSSNCGIAARFQYEGNINSIICDEIEKLYEISGNNYILVYENE